MDTKRHLLVLVCLSSFGWGVVCPRSCMCAYVLTFGACLCGCRFVIGNGRIPNAQAFDRPLDIVMITLWCYISRGPRYEQGLQMPLASGLQNSDDFVPTIKILTVLKFEFRKTQIYCFGNLKFWIFITALRWGQLPRLCSALPNLLPTRSRAGDNVPCFLVS
jgi:hypothetical protein